MLFLDIKKAYPRTDRDVAVSKLSALGIKGKILLMLDSLLHDVLFQVVMNGSVSDPYTQTDGLPEGGVLSPLLWNIFFSDIPDPGIHGSYSAFADDLAVVMTSDTAKQGAEWMSEMYAKLRNWARDNRVEFNDRKVKAMVIRPARSKRTPRPIGGKNGHGRRRGSESPEKAPHGNVLGFPSPCHWASEN